MRRFLSLAFACLCPAFFAMGDAVLPEPASEAPVKAIDFSGPQEWNVFGNASQTLLKNGGRNGGPCVDIVLGGLNSDAGGAFQICKASPGRPGSKLLSFWIDGKAGGNGGFCVFAKDSSGANWCWNGPRWDANAEISCVAGWRKVSCLLDDFKIEGAAKGAKGKLDASKIVNLQFGIGGLLETPGKKRCEFLLEDIFYESSISSGAEPKDSSPSPSSALSQERPMPEPAPVFNFDSAAELPSFVSWKMDSHWKETTPARCKVSLNNYWQVQAVDGSFVPELIARKGEAVERPQTVPRQGEWLYMKVPGRWDGKSFNVLNGKGETVKSWPNGKPLYDAALAWCRRELDIPAGWEKRDIVLEFEQLNKNAELFINGQKIRSLSQSARLDITRYVVFGKTNEIALLLSPALPLTDKQFVSPGMGAKWWYNWHEGPGVNGGVWLEALPKTGRIESVLVMPDVAKRMLSARVELAGSSPFEGEVRGAVFDGDRKVLELAGRPASFPGSGASAVELSAPWPDPVLWSPENPKLYSLRVDSASKSGLADELNIRFGFRQLAIDKGDFVLNGSKTHLRFCSNQHPYYLLPESSLRELLSELKKMNFNGLIVESLDKQTLNACDELGLMVAVRHVFTPLVRQGEYLPGVPSAGYPYQIYLSQDPKMRQARAELESSIKTLIRPFQNSPSIVIWGLNPLLCYNSDWINPNNFFEEKAKGDIIRAALAEEDFLKKLDPSRIAMHSMGASTGSVIACNPYATFCNVPDEWADWPMKWSAVKNKPLVLEEVETPFGWSYSTWYVESQRRFGGWDDSKQLFIEQSARSLGEKAYENCPKSWLDNSGWYGLTDRNVSEGASNWSELNKSVETDFARWIGRTFVAWRFYDVSGVWPFTGVDAYFDYGKEKAASFKYADVTAPGRKPDCCDKPIFTRSNSIRAAVAESQAPFLARIGGRPERFSSQERSYVSGETVRKQILMSNDAHEPLDVKASWALFRASGGSPVAKGEWSGRMESGEIVKAPLEFAAPKTEDKASFVLKLSASAGRFSSEDSFTLEAFPPLDRHAPSAEVLLYDERGDTSALLREMGVKSSALKDASQFDSHRTLVVGRGSFTLGFAKKARSLNVPARLSQGLTMLVFEQDLSSALAPYLEERRCRQVFVKTAGHPALAGLDESDLSHWRGPSDFTIEYPDSSYAKPGRFTPWGSEGSVATYVMDKPLFGRFRCVVDCDADLSRTALLEHSVGAGRAIFCQLDITGRALKDPVALRIAKNLIAYANSPEPFPVRSAAYAGDPETLKTLKNRFGAEIEELPSRARLEEFQTLVLGDAPFSGLDKDACARFVRDGGTILVLPKSEEAMRSLPLPFTPQLKTSLVRGVLCPLGVEPLLNGLGNSDFYFNLPWKARALTGLPAGSFALEPAVFAKVQDGKGAVVFLQAGPKDFAGRYGEEKAQRILSTVLSNLGVKSNTDFSFSSGGDVEIDLCAAPAKFSTDMQSKGDEQGWRLPGFDDSSWREIKVGRSWESQGVVMKNPFFKDNGNKFPYDGDAWYRIRVAIPESCRGKDLVLDMVSVDDLDWSYFNGELVGHTGEDVPKYYEFHRKYKIPARLANFGGDNVIAVKVRDLGGEGGIMGDAKITWPGAQKQLDLLYVRGSRDILDFDPNRWRQW